MILINNFEIQNNGENLAIDIETNIGSTITSVLLWNINTFKDYTKAIDLSYKLNGLDNTESFTVNAEEVDVIKFEDIWFIEIVSDFTDNECNNLLDPALGIAYNLSPYYNCLLNRFLKYHSEECSIKSLVDDTTIMINLLIEMLEKGIEYGYYLQVIDLLYKLKELCNLNKCTNCEKVICTSCSKFKQI